MLKKIFIAIIFVLFWAGVSYGATAEQVEFLISGSLKGDGSINASGKVYTCDAGTTCGPATSDPKTTWQDGNKVAAHANPIILDSIGTSVVYADGNYKFQIHDSDDNLVETIDNAFYVISSNVVQTQATLTPSSQVISTSTDTYYCNATAGDVTTDFSGVSAVGNTGQRFTFKKTDSTLNTCTIDPLSSQTIDGVTTAVLRIQYDDIMIESNGSNWTEVRGMLWSRAATFHNTVTIYNGLLTDTISEAGLGNGVTIDGVLLKDDIVFTNTIGELTNGVGITFSNTISLSKGTDVASIANLTALITLPENGNYFDVTGIANIGAINTVGVGTTVKLHFDSTVTLIHNSTDLVLPGLANITTGTNDEYEFTEYATGDWRVTGRVVNSPSHGFRVGNTASQLNITNIEKVEWNTEDWDNNHDFDLAAERFTPTATGKYLLIASILWDNAGGGGTITLYIYKNGAITGGASVSAASASVAQNLPIIVDANGTTDFFEVFAQNSADNGSDVTATAGEIWFTGSKTGQ